jgi:hypothetical protein
VVTAPSTDKTVSISLDHDGNLCDDGDCPPLAVYPQQTANFSKSTPLVVDYSAKGESCNSTSAKAAHITPFESPFDASAGSDLITGYQVGFDSHCGTDPKPDYTSVIVDLFIRTSSDLSTEYFSNAATGPYSTVSTIAALDAYGTFYEAVADLPADLLSIIDLVLPGPADIIAALGTSEFKRTVGKAIIKYILDHAGTPVLAGSEADAKMLFAAEAVVRIESAVAFQTGGSGIVGFWDDLTTVGRSSTWRLWVSDPAGINPSPSTGALLIVSETGPTQDLRDEQETILGHYERA